MKLILAQGNPGDKYARTRHNVGFMVLNAYAKSDSLDFSDKPKFFASIAEFSEAGEKVLLVKPTTFYNETGRAARALIDFYKLAPEDLLVIHDDLALPFGRLRTRDRGSDAGNNGIKSINAALGEHYARLRIGTWNELRNRMNDVEFVLGNFSADEMQQLSDTIIPASRRLIDDFIRGTLELTSHNTIEK